jgi:PPOX class probable F420-dependent enzyme
VTPAEARERFAAARVARLATADAAGRPHLVPVVFAVCGDVIYSVVDAKPKRTTGLRRLRNVAENPAVALLADHYDDADWDALWWARAEGVARVLDPAGGAEPERAEAGGAEAGRAEPGGAEAGRAEAEHAVELLRARYPQQRAVGAVLAVDVERWSGWAAAEAGA